MTLKPFLAGRKCQDTPSLRPVHGPAGSPVAGQSREHNSGPTVEVVKEGGKVVRLAVTCTCGERIEVECLYPAGN